MNGDTDETSPDVSLLGDVSENSFAETTFEQEQLYGKIMPTPSKSHEPTHLPTLGGTLLVPKSRGSLKSGGNNSIEDSSLKLRDKTNQALLTPTKEPSLKVLKRASTPGKKRNFTSPLLSRVPSLVATPIPNLSPTNETHEDSLTNPTRIITSPSTVRDFSTPLRLASWSHPTPSKLQGLKPVPMKNLIDSEDEKQIKQLDEEIKKYEIILEDLKKVKKYRDTDDSSRLDALIAKWRKAAQMASNYLFNEALLKIERMGGLDEYRKRQLESKLRKLKFNYDESVLYQLEDFMETEEYKNMSKSEQKEIIEKRNEMLKMSEKIERGEIDGLQEGQDLEDLEFTMQELFKQLNKKYDLVFPNKNMKLNE